MAKQIPPPNKVDVVKPVVIPKCENCRFYSRRANVVGVGDCRRYPPTPEGRLALTQAESYCGEFATK